MWCFHIQHCGLSLLVVFGLLYWKSLCQSSKTKTNKTKRNTKANVFISPLEYYYVRHHTTTVLTSSFQGVLNIILSEAYHSINGLCSVLCVLYSNCDQPEIRWPCFSVFGLHFFKFVMLFYLDPRAQELCESWGDCPGLPIPKYSLCEHNATLSLNLSWPNSFLLVCLGACFHSL